MLLCEFYCLTLLAFLGLLNDYVLWTFVKVTVRHSGRDSMPLEFPLYTEPF